jgi:predicted DNA-binding ribbon-helix-helix protein
MNTTITKRSVIVTGRKTSISLEDEFWHALKAIARHHQRTLSAVIGEINQGRRGNLSSAIRVFVLGSLCTPAPHIDGGDAGIINSFDRHESRSP